MRGFGRAVAYGAVTIVNAIACGYGAAVGVNLWTEAKVRITEDPGVIEGRILNDPSEQTLLIVKTVKRVLNHFRLGEIYGAYVETESNVPIARGLKSSSVAANAVTLATLSAIDKQMDDVSAVKLGVDAAMDAGVTVTGAFDDACASYLGRVVVTDNIRRRIVKIFDPGEWNVIIYVPKEKVYTGKSDVERMRIMSEEVKEIYKIASRGQYWVAMTLNGFVYSSLLGFDPNIAIKAKANGAVAAGLSGTGPSVAAVVPDEAVDSVVECWRDLEGEIIKARINREKAHLLE